MLDSASGLYKGGQERSWSIPRTAGVIKRYIFKRVFMCSSALFCVGTAVYAVGSVAVESSLHFLSLCFCTRQHAPRTLAAGNTRTTLWVLFKAVKLLNVHAHDLGPCLAFLTFPSPHWDHIHAGVLTLSSRKNNIRPK